MNIFDEQHMSFWKELYDKFLPRITKVKASKELSEISLEYEKNFEKLLDSIGTPEFTHYSKEEKRLNLKVNEGIILFIRNDCYNEAKIF